MSIWKLIKQEKTGAWNTHRKENETEYTYQSGEHTISFYSHPTIPFCVMFTSNNRKGDIDLTEFSDRWTEQGLKQHEYPGGFNEAIATIEM